MDSRPGVFLHRVMGVCPGREGTGGAASTGVQAGKGMDGPSRGPALLRASSAVCPGLWLLLNPADLGQAGSCSGGSGAIAGEGGSRSLPGWQRGQGTPRGGLHLTGDPLPDKVMGGWSCSSLCFCPHLPSLLSLVWFGEQEPLSRGGFVPQSECLGERWGHRAKGAGDYLHGTPAEPRVPCVCPCRSVRAEQREHPYEQGPGVFKGGGGSCGTSLCPSSSATAGGLSVRLSLCHQG